MEIMVPNLYLEITYCGMGGVEDYKMTPLKMKPLKMTTENDTTENYITENDTTENDH